MSLRKELERLGLEESKRFLPHTPLEALAWMDVAFSDIRSQICRSSPTSLHREHGRYLRNVLGLWHDSPLAQHFQRELQIEHPDDMSQYLLEKYILWLRSRTQNLLPWESGYEPPTL